jgi:hypothetical protein
MKSVIAGFITGLVLLSTGISSAAGVAVNGDFTLTAPGSGIVFPGGVTQTEAVTPDTYQKRVATPCSAGYAVTAIGASGNVTCTPVSGGWVITGSTVRSTARVGIGTAVPTNPLTVAGTIETTSGGVKFPDGTIKESVGDCHGRYQDNGDGTVSDCRTGLIWLKNANCTDAAGGIDKSGSYISWDKAKAWSAALWSWNGICGLNDGSTPGDWRLPTKTEWMAMVAYAKTHYSNPALTNAAGTAKWTQGDPFLNVQSSGYWSGSTNSSDTTLAWEVNVFVGNVGNSTKANVSYVWPVRAGQ